MFETVLEDIRAVKRNDPAAESWAEVLLCHTPLRIGANAFVINRDVPAGATVVGTPARIVKLRGERVDAELPRMVLPAGARPVELEV